MIDVWQKINEFSISCLACSRLFQDCFGYLILACSCLTRWIHHFLKHAVMLFCPRRFNTAILAKSFCERSNDMSSPKIVDMENPMISFFFQWSTFKLLGITYLKAFITRSLGFVRDKSPMGSDLTRNGGNSTDSKNPKTPPTKKASPKKEDSVDLFVNWKEVGVLRGLFTPPEV